MSGALAALHGFLDHVSADPWYILGFGAQALFGARFLVQWLQSERQRRSVVPVAFWFFSIAGGIGLLAYGIVRREPVIILGQGLPLVIYVRNLWLIYARRARGHGDPALTEARALVERLTSDLAATASLAGRPVEVDQSVTRLAALLHDALLHDKETTR